MKKKTYPIPVRETAFSLICLLACTGTAYGDFQVVDDFEDGNLDEWGFFNEQGAATPPEDQDELGEATIVIDPVLASGNSVMRVRPGTGVVIDNAFRLDRPMPGIVEDSTGTVYVRFAMEGLGLDATFGQTERKGDLGDGRWDLYRTIFRNNNGVIDVRDGTSYEASEFYQVSALTWYEVWFVIENNFSFDLGTGTILENDRYKVFIKGGALFPTQTQIFALEPADPEDPESEIVPVEWFDFRPSDGIGSVLSSIDRFMILMTTRNAASFAGDDYLFFDDIYIDLDGENLSTPVEGANIRIVAPKIELASGETAEVCFSTVNGATYSLQVSGDTSGWSESGQTDISGDGNEACFTVSTDSGQDRLFFRVLEEQ